MINFLDPKLLPKITSKPPCTENYEPENLISTQYMHKSRGFIAYPSIKPPVELEFELICNVNIRYIFLNTSVGSQRCSGIQILVKQSVAPYVVSIGRAVYDATNIQRVIFCDKRQYSATNPPPGYNSENTALYFFTSGTYKSFLNASKVKIVIFRTERSVPCLAAVEIWGVPSKTSSQKTIDTVYRLKEAKGTSELVVPSSAKNDSFKIPDEFKDDLTYELMTIPYTLPSGKTIDQTTLEKHVESEKSFARKPCDPFTGVKFTQTLKPILNVSLKSRIDMFLLENSHRTETFGLKRTLRMVTCASKKIKTGNDDVCPPKHGINNHHTLNSISNADSDLDLLIKKVKNDNPNFISFTDDTSKSTEKICISCKNTDDECLYELPCEHYYCRKCLLRVCETSRCKQCDNTFLKSDVKRIEYN